MIESKYKVGIIGVGVVGGAMAAAFPDAALCDVAKGHKDWAGIIASDVCFVCVGTSNIEGGKQDLGAVRQVFWRLEHSQYQGVVALRSTVLPGTTRKLQEEFGLRTVFYPEFLRAEHAAEEFGVLRFAVLGGQHQDIRQVCDALGGGIRLNVASEYADPTEAEMVKYFHNCFMAVKLSFANEMAAVCDWLGIEYDGVKDGAVSVGRIHPGHLDVPGPDGRRGWGGACLPKDVEAFLGMISKKHQCATLAGAVQSNKAWRPTDLGEDWCGTHDKNHGWPCPEGD